MKELWELDGDHQAGWTEMCKLLASEGHPDFAEKTLDGWLTLKRQLFNSKLISSRPVHRATYELQVFTKSEVVMAVRRLHRGETGSVEQIYRLGVGRTHMSTVKGQYARARKSLDDLEDEIEPNGDPSETESDR